MTDAEYEEVIPKLAAYLYEQVKQEAAYEGVELTEEGLKNRLLESLQEGLEEDIRDAIRNL